MRTTILATAHDLHLRHHRLPDLDEIAACAGITRHHLRGYFTSPQGIADTITADVASTPTQRNGLGDALD